MPYYTLKITLGDREFASIDFDSLYAAVTFLNSLVLPKGCYIAAIVRNGDGVFSSDVFYSKQLTFN